MVFAQKNLKFFFFHFFSHLFFSCYYCSIDLHRQSELKELRTDASSFVLTWLTSKKLKLAKANKDNLVISMNKELNFFPSKV